MNVKMLGGGSWSPTVPGDRWPTKAMPYRESVPSSVPAAPTRPALLPEAAASPAPDVPGHAVGPVEAPRRGPLHEVVVLHTGPFGRASCTTCGWQGPGRRAHSRIVDDAEEHRELT